MEDYLSISASSTTVSTTSEELSCSASFTFADRNNNRDRRENSKTSEEFDEDEEEVVEEEEEEDEESEEEEQTDSKSSSVSRGMSAGVEEDIDIEDLESICTIGTGTFGRVELCKHRLTSHHYALKILNIHKIVSTQQVDHVHNEKRVLEMLDHPFIVKLISTAMDNRNLYMIMEFVQGGELFSYLRASRIFSNSMARFYAAEIILALEYIHSKNIVYRDLKPENLMITKKGHIKLADFGFAKILRDRTYTLCGTPEYLSPETLNHKGHNRAVDWWALGILIYEMLAGRPPFRGYHVVPRSISRVKKLKQERVSKLSSPDFLDLVKKFLDVDRTTRLGCMAAGAADVKEHKWFEKVDWAEMEKLNVQPPIVPTLYHDADTGNFDDYANEERTGPAAPKRELDMFQDW